MALQAGLPLLDFNLIGEHEKQEYITAVQAGLDRSYVGGIERGERNITFDTMCVIAKTLNIKLSELLKGI